MTVVPGTGSIVVVGVGVVVDRVDGDDVADGGIGQVSRSGICWFSHSMKCETLVKTLG